MELSHLCRILHGYIDPFIINGVNVSYVLTEVVECLKIWGGAHCFHMQVKVAVLNVISQNYNFFEV